jgi:hypothetical protein
MPVMPSAPPMPVGSRPYSAGQIIVTRTTTASSRATAALIAIDFPLGG